MSLRSGFTLGDWTVYPLEGRLSRAGEDNRVQPKSMEVLLHLAAVGGEVVERDNVLHAIWGERAVSDEPLTRCIGELRKALGDSRTEPRYIQTIPKRGYRLLKPVVPLEPVAAAPASVSSQILSPGKLWIALAIVIVGAIGLAVGNRTSDRGEGEATPEVTASTAQRSIVVLPFADMSEAGDQEHMSDGIAEELLNLLAGIPELRVISRTSAFSFKGKPVDISDIAEQLRVAYVLEGSVRTSGDRIRITTQLIDARTDTHIWSDTYDRELRDLFAIQDDISAAVANKLELTLLGNAPKTRPTDPEAYSLFLQARYLHEQPAGDSFQRAFDYYKAALAIDEDYVPAWVWLAALYDDTVNSSALPYEEVGRRAREAIDRALAIDSGDPLALGMSGVLRAAWDEDYETAAAHMHRALQGDPNNPILLRWAAILLVFLGRHEEAIEINEYLFDRDPVGIIAKINLASTYLLAGRWADAARVCEIQVAVDEKIGPCRSRLIVAYLHTGELDKALRHLQAIEGTRMHTRLAAMVFDGLDREDDFLAAIKNLEDALAAGDTGLAYWLARTYTITGDTDAALHWYEEAARQGVLDISPAAAYYNNVRQDPRWIELMQQTGLSSDDLGNIDLEVAIPSY